VVLDLRNNPGGVLGASVDVAGLFMRGGQVVYTEGRLPNAAQSYDASKDDVTNGVPMVVLINGGSASASEIVAGALQDHGRAVIMGTDSFGKGSVQTVIPISDSRAVKLTTALYFTPGGRSIQAAGIVPDIRVDRARVTTVGEGNRISEADLLGHLSNSEGEERRTLEANELQARDNQLYEALTLLKGVNILGMNRSRPSAASLARRAQAERED
jgi:carboxyl-terminal processing protease